MLSLKEMMTLMGIVTADPSLPMEKPKLVGVSPIQATCLAENVYFEARNQGTAGWSAVISVTLNRVKDKRFPNTICEVVKFSWYCDGKADKIHKKDKRIYKEIYNLAYVSLIKGITILDITDGATHYHADYVFPAWRKSKTKTVEIGDHIFYKWKK